MRDLDDIWSYIARDSADMADRVVDDICQAVDKLAEMPKMGHYRDDLTVSKSVRFWSVRSYVIVYRTDIEPIEVARILSGFRDIPSEIA